MAFDLPMLFQTEKLLAIEPIEVLTVVSPIEVDGIAIEGVGFAQPRERDCPTKRSRSKLSTIRQQNLVGPSRGLNGDTAEQTVEHQLDHARSGGFTIDEVVSDNGVSGPEHASEGSLNAMRGELWLNIKVMPAHLWEEHLP
jgi:hypothetical protein